MRTLGSWGMIVALVTVLAAASVRAGDDDDKPVKRRANTAMWKRTTAWNAMGRMVGLESQPDEKKPADKKSADKKTVSKQKKETAAATPAKKDLVIDDESDERSREEAAYLRRSAACLKLQEIAVRTDDAELMRRAEQLNERAWAAYSQRSMERGAAPSADEQVVEKYLSSGKEVKLPKPGSKLYTVTGKEEGSPAKEEKR